MVDLTQFEGATREDWRSYSDCKPDAEGTYEWRVPSRRVDGLVVRFLAVMKMRNAGYEEKLAPSFAYWDGYRLNIPANTEWRPSSEVVKSYDTKLVAVEDVSNCECPFCGKEPTFKGVEESMMSRGVFVGSAPYDYNRWWLECCSYANSPQSPDPRTLAKFRNGKLSEVKRLREALKQIKSTAMQQVLSDPLIEDEVAFVEIAEIAESALSADTPPTEGEKA